MKKNDEKTTESTKIPKRKGVGHNGNGKPFPIGNCANPNGRPRKGSALADIMRDYLDGTINTDNGTLSRGEAFIRALYARAMKGGDGAQTKILHYIEGMPIQRVETKVENVENPLAGMTTEQVEKYLDKLTDEE